MLRDGIRRALEHQPNVTILGEARSGREALELDEKTAPDLILLDIHLPDLDGIAVSRQILARRPTAKILVFSADANRSLVDEALGAGVRGYLAKDAVPEELTRAISMVMEGRLYLSPELASSVIGDHVKALASPAAPAALSLSEHEQQMLRFVAEGLPNKAIATRFGLSIKAVEKQRSRLMDKLGCHSAAELIRYAIRQGIAPC